MTRRDSRGCERDWNTWPAGEDLVDDRSVGTDQMASRATATSAPDGSLGSMRRLTIEMLVALGAALAVWGLAGSTASASGRRSVRRCAPRHAKIIVANKQAEVYEGLGAEGLPMIFGCPRTGERSYLLGERARFSSAGGGGIVHEMLAGAVVAFEAVTGGPGSSSYFNDGHGTGAWLVMVRDLRTGRWLHRVPTGAATISGDRGVGPVVALVVKADGAVAWIAENAATPPGAPHEYELHALDKSGSRVLVTGTEIVPKSLALTGSTLHWTVGGKLFSAPLD
jgi:hypothetical protein